METPETHIQKIREAIQLFKKHDTSITLPPDKWVSVFSVMEEYASIRAEQARQEERERHKYIVAAMHGLIESDFMPGITKEGMKFHLREAGYGKEEK